MISMSEKLVEIEPMSEEQCWASIDRVAEVMTVPGMMQSELKADSDLGKPFTDNAKQILHIIVDHFDAGESPDGDELIDGLNDLFIQNQALQTKYTIKLLTQASIAMQQLPLAAMITSIQDTEALDGLTQEGLEELKAMETEDKKSGMARIEPRLMKIMGLGIDAAGGQLEFARLQKIVSDKMPEHFKASPEIAFTSQMIGAIMTAVTARAESREFTLSQIRATIEMVIGAKQALTLANMTAYHMGSKEVVGILVRSAEHHINISVDETVVEVPEKQKVEIEATHVADHKPTSTHVAGNRTVN